MMTETIFMVGGLVIIILVIWFAYMPPFGRGREIKLESNRKND